MFFKSLVEMPLRTRPLRNLRMVSGGKYKINRSCFQFEAENVLEIMNCFRIL